jgi:hypothetical protein
MKKEAWMWLMAGACYLPWAVGAGTRTSGNYTIAADEIAGGGQAFSSAGYGGASSVGSVGGSSTSLPSRVARHGYVGQLYDFKGLNLAASPTNVDEGATRQLASVLALDDHSRLALSPSLVSWSVTSGAIFSVSESGLAMAAMVYQDTQAVVRGVYQTFSNHLGLMVLNTNIDDYGSYAMDGIDDAWQVRYFGLENAQAGPMRDPDNDRQNNYFEYIAGTMPIAATSAFYLAIAAVPGVPTDMNILFRPRFADRQYDVRISTNLLTGAFLNLPAGVTNDVGEQRMVTDTNAMDRLRLYRVKIQRP